MLPPQSTHRYHLLANVLLSLSLTAWGAAPAQHWSSPGSDPPPPPSDTPISSEDGLPGEADPPWLPVQPAASLPVGGSQEDGWLGGDQPRAADALAPELAPPPAQPDRLPAALRAFDLARNAGPEAVLAFEAAADPEVRAVIRAEVTEARRLLTKPLDTYQPELGPVVNIAGINGPCAYSTLQAAITAATSGDSLRVVGQTITESIDITGGKVLTITGGYDATCTTPVTGTRTTLQGAGGSVVDVSASQVTLSSLILSGGTGFGAGVDLYGLAAQATLSNTRVQFNAGTQGGGIYVSYSNAVTLTNGSMVYSNTAALYGGGAAVYGRLTALGTTSDFSTNAASLDGGNLYVVAATVYLDNADVVAGRAVQRGGGLLASDGAVITLTNSVFVGESSPCCQSAADGGGIYADNSQVYLLGAETTVMRNTAANNGGGVYLTNGSYLYSDGANIGNTAADHNANTAVLGGGLYVVNSTVEFSGRIFNNTASTSGGGLYASSSTITFTNVTVGGTGVNDPNTIGAAGRNGAGLYLVNDTRATLSATVIVSNTLTNPDTGYGGGVYIRAGSILTATNSRIERHLAPSDTDGRGAGLYIYDATVTLINTQVLSNVAANLGGGARLFGASTLNVLAGSTFSDNQALNGEGGALAGTDMPAIHVTDATFQGNTAATSGGAIYLVAGTLDFGGAWAVRFNAAGAHGGAVALMGTADADFAAQGGLSDSYLADNTAGGNGGALYVDSADAIQLHATSGRALHLSTNSAGGDGGALYSAVNATFDLYGQLRVTGNSAGGGGGVAYLNSARIWLDDYFAVAPQVWANQAATGGAIYAVNSDRVECDGADFGLAGSGNSATTGSGGAVYLSGSLFTADNCRFRDNQALAGHGGALAAFTSTVSIDVDYAVAATSALGPGLQLETQASQATACHPLDQVCSSLIGNRAGAADNGGAIFASQSVLMVNNTYLHHNTAARGGAIYQEGAGATAWVSNTLAYSNTSLLGLGAGIRNAGGAITLTQVTLAHNSGGAGLSASGDLNYLYNTIIWGNSLSVGSGLSAAVCSIDQAGAAGPVTNPLFAAPGAGENYRLRPGSPAVDACDTGAPIDLDNRARPVGDGFDVGAYEIVIQRVYLPLTVR